MMSTATTDWRARQRAGRTRRRVPDCASGAHFLEFDCSPDPPTTTSGVVENARGPGPVAAEQNPVAGGTGYVNFAKQNEQLRYAPAAMGGLACFPEVRMGTLIAQSRDGVKERQEADRKGRT
jgi:hypothetical protein